MKIRLADYVARFLVENGVDTGFSVVGGGAMHLNDAFGHKKGLKMYYNHHEQASAIAAEGYARLNNKMALVCATSGPGGINTMTGIACAYLDSLPMFVVTGQVRYDTTARYAYRTKKAHLRAMGDQEYDITKSTENMTKYAVMVEDAKDIRFVCERAYHLATTGRMGPVHIDIPVDIQGTMIETDNLTGYMGTKTQLDDDKVLPGKTKEQDLDEIIKLIYNAKRPVIYAGYGIRLAGAYEEFRKLIRKLNIPVVTYWNAIDLIEDDNILYCGRGGNMGDRPGNFAVQNSDLLITIGTRLSIRQVGYNYKEFARAAKIVMVDVDAEEFKKPTLNIYKKVHADAKEFIIAMENFINKKKLDRVFEDKEDWIGVCNNWKYKYPVVDSKKYEDTDKVNVYAFMKTLSDALKKGTLTVVSNGACCVVGSQCFTIKKGTRFHNNSAIASMGYGLPASIGACVSNGKKETICLEGDGSIMMNLQELQTIITNRLPIKIFMINNGGYHSIRITQDNIFAGRSKVGIGPDSNDLWFPQYERIAKAFGFNYISIKKNKELKARIEKVLDIKGPLFVEVWTNKTQVWEPKNSARKLANGKIVSPPLEDLAPFLSREELKSNMFI